jgi:hypothetical protein
MEFIKKELRRGAFRLKFDHSEQVGAKERKSGVSTARGLLQHALLRADGTNLGVLSLGSLENVPSSK